MRRIARRRWASATTRCRSRRRSKGSRRRCRPLFAGKPRDITEENLQSRARGTILMSISNKFGADGGDDRQQIRDVGRLRDALWRHERRLQPDQGPLQDGGLSGSLLCAIAGSRTAPWGRMESSFRRTSSPRRRPPSCARTRRTRIRCRLTMCSTTSCGASSKTRCACPRSWREGHDLETVKKVERLLYLAEYKRRQSAPGVKVTRKNFGRDRRYPIVNRFRDPGQPRTSRTRRLARAIGQPRSDAIDFSQRRLRAGVPFVIKGSMTKPIVRFAPSPTGLHPYRQRPPGADQCPVRAAGGRRCSSCASTTRTSSVEAGICGCDRGRSRMARHLRPTSIVRQSERFATLRRCGCEPARHGRLYACYETPEELEFRRKRQLARGLPPIYDRAALKLTADDNGEAGSRRAPAPLAVPSRSSRRWSGTISCAAPSPCGCEFAVGSGAGPRGWHLPLYAALGRRTISTSRITHVIRGEDHVTNTAVQIQISRRWARRFRPSATQPAHHRERRGAVEASRAPVAQRACARPGSSRRPWRRSAVLVGSAESVRAGRGTRRTRRA